MKYPGLICLFMFWGIATVNAQYGQWVWMAGDSSAGQGAVYGTQGLASPLNHPAARYEGADWVDLQGNFWHFGGRVNNTSMNDLWKFDPVTKQWTWMKGSNVSSQPGVYGTMGVAAAANTPGARAYASVSWTDLQGNLWLFGGYGYTQVNTVGYLNDLWKYDPITNMWAWMGGTSTVNQPGVYGTKGISSPNTHPGGREETSASWVDAQGRLWLFGGNGLAANLTVGYLNDLWMYDPVLRRWTWMSGDNAINSAGVWGTKGAAAAANKPSSGLSFASSRDLNGNFWLMGASTSSTLGDDLWKYDPGTNMWTWMKGSTNGSAVNFGAQCVEDTATNPMALFEQRTRWTDDCGNMWLFGGFTTSAHSNALFRYSVKNNSWTWVSGSASLNQAGNHGILGLPSPLNMPSSRGGAMPFRRPGQNELWVFGGGGGGEWSDMWMFLPDKPTAAFTESASGSCPLSRNFSNASSPGCNEIKSYLWDFGDTLSGLSNTSTQVNPNHTFTGGGNFTVKLLVINCTGSRDSISKTISIPSTQSTTLTITDVLCPGGNSGSISASVSGGSGPYTYSWSNAQTLSSATGLSAGNYFLVLTDGNGCSTTLTGTVSEGTGPTAVAGNDTTIDAGSAATLKASGGVSYSWAPDAGLSCSNCQFPSASPSNTTVYTVTVTDSNGCTDTATVTVFVELHCEKGVFVPSAFSPNGDGRNDVLYVYGNCLKEFSFFVFDRWGEKVFESSDAKKGWDGLYKGENMSTGVYVFSLRGIDTDGKEVIKKGNVSLLR